MSIDRSIDTREARRNGLPKTTGSLVPLKGRCGHLLYMTGPKAPNPGPLYPAKYCMTYPMKQKQYCRQHGGKSPTGMASQFYTNGTGIYGPVLRTAMAKSFEQILTSDDVLSLRQEIAVAKAWMVEIVGQLQDGTLLSGEAAREVDEVGSAWHGLERAVKAGKAEGFTAAMDAMRERVGALRETMTPAARERTAMAEFRKWALTLEKLEARENQRVSDGLNLLSPEKAFAFVAALQKIVKEAIVEHVPEVAVQNALRRRIAGELSILAPRGDGTRVLAGGGSGEGVTADSPAGDAGGTRRLLSDVSGADVSE